MHNAALAGKMAELQLHLEVTRGDALLDALDAAGDTPLHMAALGGHSSLVKRLIDECAEVVHVQDNQGWTALHYAASNGNFGVASALIDAGARLVSDNNGNTPAHEAAIKGHGDVGKAIIEQTARTTEPDAHRAACACRNKPHGESALMLAAGRGLTPLCKALLLHGADSNGPANRDGWTALHYAAAQGRTGPTKLLLQSGANVNARSVEGQTALHFSCAKNAAATSEALVEGGADLRVISARGATALHACYNNKGEGCCKVLLHKAAQIGSLQALIVARDVNGKTALDLATAVVNRPLATLLRHTVAAMIIQVSARKFTRRQLDFKAAMATRIQRIYRGRHTRKQYKQTVRARDLRLNHAARVIQRRYRKWAGNRKKRDVLGSSAQHQTVYIDDLEKETATEWDKEEAKEVRSAIDKRRREDRKMRQEEAIAHQEQMALEDRKRGEAKRRQERREQEMAESSAAGSERSFADRQDIGEERPMMISDRSNDAPSRGSQRPGRGPDMAGAGSNDKTASGGGAMDGMFALVAEELQADEAERKRNRGPGIDLGAIVKSLEQLETRTIVRFGQLQEAVAIMASKVGVLEQKLNADLEYDHLVHVQAARERQRKGFFHEVKHMSATVSKMREEHQAAVAQDSVLRGEVLDDGALHPSLEEQDFANAEKKSKSCVLQ